MGTLSHKDWTSRCTVWTIQKKTEAMVELRKFWASYYVFTKKFDFKIKMSSTAFDESDSGDDKVV